MRRFIIGAVAAAAVFASAAAPAHATHSTVCTPPEAGPPICADGVEHFAEEVKRQAAIAYSKVHRPVADTVVTGYAALDTIPEPLCVAETGVCVRGVREYAKWFYVGWANLAVGGPHAVVCQALQRPECWA
jgi:hypothetical protein